MKQAARLVALVGAALIGWFLLGARPREVVLVYDASTVPTATAVEVDLRQRGTLVRHARILLDRADQARHPIRLPEGTYELTWRLERQGGAVNGTRTLEISGDQTIVLPLGR